MTKESDENKAFAKHLGYDRVAYVKGSRHGGQMEIFAGGGCDEGAYYPAQSITLSNIEGIRALHELTTEFLVFLAEREELAKNLK